MENNNVTLNLGNDAEAQAAQRTKTIRELNDRFRRSGAGGQYVVTQGINALGTEAVVNIVLCVRMYDNFNEDNDPHGEHDFGAFDFDTNGREGIVKVFWKIDYYGKRLDNGSDDPSDPEKTTRVLTIMLASEY